jgi:hypothetical protein
MLHQCAVLCNKLLQTILNCTKLHSTNQNVEVGLTGEHMSKAQQVFEALMRSKGHTDFNMNATGKYSAPALQMRWSYFQLGWEMKGVTA